MVRNMQLSLFFKVHFWEIIISEGKNSLFDVRLEMRATVYRKKQSVFCIYADLVVLHVIAFYGHNTLNKSEIKVWFVFNKLTHEVALKLAIAVMQHSAAISCKSSWLYKNCGVERQECPERSRGMSWGNDVGMIQTWVPAKTCGNCFAKCPTFVHLFTFFHVFINHSCL